MEEVNDWMSVKVCVWFVKFQLSSQASWRPQQTQRLWEEPRLSWNVTRAELPNRTLDGLVESRRAVCRDQDSLFIRLVPLKYRSKICFSILLIVVEERWWGTQPDRISGFLDIGEWVSIDFGRIFMLIYPFITGMDSFRGSELGKPH